MGERHDKEIESIISMMQDFKVLIRNEDNVNIQKELKLQFENMKRIVDDVLESEQISLEQKIPLIDYFKKSSI